MIRNRAAFIRLVLPSVFLLLLVSSVKAQTPSAKMDGVWNGVLAIGEAKLRLALKITTTPDGLTAVMDSPDQPNGGNLKVDSITLQTNVFRFEMKALLIVYEGTLSKDGYEIAGTFTQASQPFPMIFRKEGAPVNTTVTRRGRIDLRPCNNPTLTSEILCGKYEVFENRTSRKGRKISLNIMLLPALSEKPALDPLFYLAGGPGGAATSYAAERFMGRLRRNRDVVLVDQRGTGQSNPLNCPPAGSREDMRGFFGEVMPLERIRACRAELEKIADLKLYTTSIAMDDLDEVREALGYDRIDLYGGSYGSTTTLVYLRQHPKRVRAAAVFGVSPPSAKIPLSFAKGVQEAIDRLFADCAKDSTCHDAYPNVENDFQTLLSKFDKGPVEVDVPNIYTGAQQKVSVSRDAFVDAIRQLLYVPAAASALPALIHHGATGNLGPLIGTAFQIVLQIDSKIARGMQFSVLCAEDAPFITEAEIKLTSAGSFYGDARVRPTIRACGEWTAQKSPKTFLDPVKSTAPVLLVAGDVDPVTPPWLAEQAARTLPNGRLVIVKNATHSSYDCVEAMVADFIDKGTTQGLDTSCSDQVKRPPFAVLDSK
ncbi:MAG TPA: alpha/beta hydrolase [Pyrinomonadaceae bacterium]|nr:alpha/beta hydrolase [Pyrinomonadaceae bacterium]